MVRPLVDRLIGRRIERIENSEPGYGIGIILSGNASFNVNTEVTARLPEESTKQIESATIKDGQLTMHLTGNGFVTVSLDRARFADVVELYVYLDDEGYVVEN